MPCNCGSSKKFNFIYTDTNGRQSTYDTEISAKAAQVRAGGGGSIRKEAKP